MNNRLMVECIRLGGEITKNSYNAVKLSKMLINKGMDADLQTGLRLEINGWALCFAHDNKKVMMSAFLNRTKRGEK
jgi:3-hydroxypropionyl-coenzyme A dehydratase